MWNREAVSLIRLVVGFVVEQWLKNEAGRTDRPSIRRGPFSDAVMLGNAYEHGKGVKRDLAESVRWYRRVVAQSNDWGRAKLAALYARGAVKGIGCAEAMPPPPHPRRA